MNDHGGSASAQTEALICEVIAEHFGVPLQEVTPSARFRQDLGADSLDIVSLTMTFEELLGIEIADEESEQCATVEEAFRLVEQKRPASTGR